MSHQTSAIADLNRAESEAHSDRQQLAARGAQLFKDSGVDPLNSDTVYVVDDDAGMREVIVSMIARSGLKAQAFESANDFLAQYIPDSPGCLVTDLQMPGMDGLSLVRRLKECAATLPVIVVTGSGDIEAAVQAMHLSAVDVLLKPFDGRVLCDRIRQSLELNALRRESLNRRNAARALLDRLTEREHEVLHLIVAGLDNRQIALRTRTSERAVEAHRDRISRKLLARNDYEVARLTLAGNQQDPHRAT